MEKNRYIEKSHFYKIILGLIIVLAISIVGSTGILSNGINKRQKIKEAIKLTNNISIGFNKDYVNETIGNPFLHYYDEENNIEDNLYKIPGAILRIMYKNNSAIGIFVTINDRNYIGVYGSEEIVGIFEQKLGNFSFNEPSMWGAKAFHNFFYTTTGPGYVYYIEVAWMYPAGNSQYEYLAGILPYGIYIPEHFTNRDIIKESSHSSNHSGYLGDFVPNTYGIIIGGMTDEVESLLLSPHNVDIRSLNIFEQDMSNRNKYNYKGKVKENIDEINDHYIDNIPDNEDEEDADGERKGD